MIQIREQTIHEIEQKLSTMITGLNKIAYLESALAEGDSALVVQALGAIAKARGMARIAKATGLRRESLYKALSPEGNPEFKTVLKVVRALGIKLHAETLHAIA